MLVGQMREFIENVKRKVKHLDKEITAGTTNNSERGKEAKNAQKKLEWESNHTNIEFEDSDSMAGAKEEIQEEAPGDD